MDGCNDIKERGAAKLYARSNKAHMMYLRFGPANRHTRQVNHQTRMQKNCLFGRRGPTGVLSTVLGPPLGDSNNIKKSQIIAQKELFLQKRHIRQIKRSSVWTSKRNTNLMTYFTLPSVEAEKPWSATNAPHGIKWSIRHCRLCVRIWALPQPTYTYR